MENETKNQIKLTEEELKRIKEIRTTYESIIIKFGQIKLDKISTTKVLKQLEDIEFETEIELNKIQKEEKEFTDKLVEKYGAGEINIENGTINPMV